ncbi:small nuclear ribonucleoprotein-associated protein B'-like [Canis lupus familiaris]|uniref:small nuclear ribonucleoprotein-associated protein B'-like n=1 Tax=Canis lupus familiaris TaxID=9615 RepID=UPI0018F45AFE|nr:small nuclear ribonucleoprotein-associated protein B'-like [Canis lupus familiaris]
MSIRGFDSFMKLVINECIKMAGILEDHQQHTETNRINGRGRAMDRTDDRTKRKFQSLRNDGYLERVTSGGGGPTLWDVLKHARNAKETPGIPGGRQPARAPSRLRRSWKQACGWPRGGGGGTTLKGLLTERGKLTVGSARKFGWVSRNTAQPRGRSEAPEQAGGAPGGGARAPPRLQRPHEPSVRLRKARPHSIWLLGARRQRRSLPGMLRGSDGPTSLPFPTQPPPPSRRGPPFP